MHVRRLLLRSIDPVVEVLLVCGGRENRAFDLHVAFPRSLRYPAGARLRSVE